MPTPTDPAFVTTKRVPVEEPITNAGAVPFALVGLMESWAQGEDEPTPTKPAEVKVVVAVPPIYALYAESWVEEARENC